MLQCDQGGEICHRQGGGEPSGNDHWVEKTRERMLLGLGGLFGSSQKKLCQGQT